MAVKKKTIIDDTGSALLREAVRQMNESVAPVSTFITTTNGGDEYVPLGMGGMWIVNIVIGLDDASDLAAATTGFKIQTDTSGKWAAPVTIANRTDFDTSPGADMISGDLVPFNDLTTDTAVSTGSLPIWVPATAGQARLLISNNEGGDRVMVVHVQVRPAEYELEARPNYVNRLQNFRVQD